jgi:F0F1-type ATP synthase membrane subunit a
MVPEAAHGLSRQAVEIALLSVPVQQVPSGAQNSLEWIVDQSYGILESPLGRHLTGRTFWFFGSIVIFILASASSRNA